MKKKQTCYSIPLTQAQGAAVLAYVAKCARCGRKIDASMESKQKFGIVSDVRLFDANDGKGSRIVFAAFCKQCHDPIIAAFARLGVKP